MKPISCAADLRALRQWVVFDLVPQPDGKKPKKVPRIPGTNQPAHVDKPGTWRTHAEAAADAKHTGRVPGVALTPAMGLTLVDVDGRIDRELIATLDSYAEESINGGLHILVRGRPPAGFVAPAGIEVYPRDGNRFVLLTETIIDGRDTIEDRTETLTALFPPAPAAALLPSAPMTLDDNELLARAFAAVNGAELERLLAGDLNGHGNDHSAADLAAASKLAFWTQDPEQITRIIGAWPLGSRDKWQKRPDYQRRTVDKALHRSAFYTPPAPIVRSGVNEHHAGLVAEAADPCAPVRDELAELRAENARLRSENAALQEQLAIIRGRLDKAESAGAFHRAAMALLGNEALNPAERIVAIMALKEVAADDRGDPDGTAHHIPTIRVAERAGVSESTATAAIKRLEDGLMLPDPAGGDPTPVRVITRSVHWAPAQTDPNTGEPVRKKQAFYSRLNSDLAGDLRTLSRAVRVDARNHGGKRTPCPTCGSTRRRVVCADCSHVLSVDPVPNAPEVNEHDAGLVAAQPAVRSLPARGCPPLRTVNLATYHKPGTRTEAEKARAAADLQRRAEQSPAPWDAALPEPSLPPTLFPLDDAPPSQSHHFSAD